MTITVALRHPPAATLADRLAEARPAAASRDDRRRLTRQLLAPLAIAALAVAVWSAAAPLSGAIVAAGQVQAASGRKAVQHQEGGIVREILVREGQPVRRGDALLVVGDVRSDAALDLLRRQRDAERLRMARARAELALQPTFAPSAEGAGDAETAESARREQQLFEARRQALAEQLDALQRQQREAGARVAALAAQRRAAEQSVALARDELAVQQELVASGFVQRTRLLGLERAVAEAEARVQSVTGEASEAQMQQGALAAAVAQARGAYRQRAADELKDAGAKLRELEERLRPTQDQAERQVVRAPVDGHVMGLRATAPGAVVAPRETLLEIAPSAESLVVALRVDPHDIDHVRAGAAAEVRLAAYDARRAPRLAARVVHVSPDALAAAEGVPRGYLAQVEVAADELARQPQLRLQPGMPAEVFVATPPRSLLAYLLEPLGLFTARALREP